MHQALTCGRGGKDCVLGGGGGGGGRPYASRAWVGLRSRPVLVQVSAAALSRREAKAKPRLGQGWLTGKSGGEA